MPRIGIYDKWLKRDAPAAPADSNFSMVMGHCTDKDNLRRENTDWKNIGKGEDEQSCRHKCNEDETCAAYEYTWNTMICVHWFGESTTTDKHPAA